MNVDSQSHWFLRRTVSKSILVTLFLFAAGPAGCLIAQADDVLNTTSEADGVVVGPPEVLFTNLPKEKEASGSIFVDVSSDPNWEIRNLRCEPSGKDNSKDIEMKHMELKQRAATEEEQKSRERTASLKAIDFVWKPERNFKEQIEASIKFDVAFVENGTERVVARAVPVTIGTASRMTISGEIINRNQILMDVVKSSRGKKMFFAVKVRDDEKRLSIKSFKSTVKCLKLHLEPSKDWEKNGLYRLVFEIPKNSEPEWHMSNTDYGVVDIVFDHPRIKPAQFLVQVAVVDED